MIGILLALQVNNWNQERIERRTENVLLEQLQKDLKMSLSDVNLNILFHENAMQSAKLLLAHMASELPTMTLWLSILLPHFPGHDLLLTQ